MKPPFNRSAIVLTGCLAAAPALANQGEVRILKPLYQAGEPAVIEITGTPGSAQCLFVDTDCTPTPIPGIGVLDIGFSPNLFIVNLPPVPADGSLELPVSLKCGSPYLGTTFCLQAIQMDGSTFSLVTTTSDTLLFQDTIGKCQNVCAGGGSIEANFNGTNIATGRTVWFNSIVKIQNPASVPANYNFTKVTIAFDACGQHVVLDLPDSLISFSPSVGSASTIYDALADVWVTQVPSGYSGNVFLSGCGYELPPGLCGDFDNVTWSGVFGSQGGNPSFQWKWASAVYTEFPSDKNAIGVKPIDGSTLNPFNNSHKAGTPEFYTQFVIGGAMGGGGSNFTGSYSGTKTNACE